MKDGYYWAKSKRWREAEWSIVEVFTYVYMDGHKDDHSDVLELGSDVFEEIEDYEFGDRIENEKYV